MERKKKLLVLDINGLLVDTCYKKTQQERPRRPPDAYLGNFLVYKRPFCDEFLQFCFENFSLGIWSSAKWRNVKNLVNYIFGEDKAKLAFSWHQKHCTDSGLKSPDNGDKPLFLKELSKLWEKQTDSAQLPWKEGEYGPTNTLLIDDTPYKALRNPPNTAIFPGTYKADNLGDIFLVNELRSYLEGVGGSTDVQIFVKQNPLGESMLTCSSPHWGYLFHLLKQPGEEEDTHGKGSTSDFQQEEEKFKSSYFSTPSKALENGSTVELAEGKKSQEVYITNNSTQSIMDTVGTSINEQLVKLINCNKFTKTSDLATVEALEYDNKGSSVKNTDDEGTSAIDRDFLPLESSECLVYLQNSWVVKMDLKSSDDWGTIKSRLGDNAVSEKMESEGVGINPSLALWNETEVESSKYDKYSLRDWVLKIDQKIPGFRDVPKSHPEDDRNMLNEPTLNSQKDWMSQRGNQISGEWDSTSSYSSGVSLISSNNIQPFDCLKESGPFARIMPTKNVACSHMNLVIEMDKKPGDHELGENRTVQTKSEIDPKCLYKVQITERDDRISGKWDTMKFFSRGSCISSKFSDWKRTKRYDKPNLWRREQNQGNIDLFWHSVKTKFDSYSHKGWGIKMDKEKSGVWDIVRSHSGDIWNILNEPTVNPTNSHKCIQESEREGEVSRNGEISNSCSGKAFLGLNFDEGNYKVKYLGDQNEHNTTKHNLKDSRSSQMREFEQEFHFRRTKYYYEFGRKSFANDSSYSNQHGHEHSHFSWRSNAHWRNRKGGRYFRRDYYFRHARRYKHMGRNRFANIHSGDEANKSCTCENFTEETGECSQYFPLADPWFWFGSKGTMCKSCHGYPIKRESNQSWRGQF